MESADVGLPTAPLSTAALGKKGGRYIVGFIMGVSLVGWFGVQAAVCGASFSIAFADLTGFEIPVWISAVVLGALMLASANLRLRWREVGEHGFCCAAVCHLRVRLGHPLSRVLALDSIFNYVPVEGMGLAAGISVSVGLFAVGGASVGDFTRYAKDRKAAVVSSVVGVWPVNILVLMMGAVLAIAVPESGGDITIVLSSMGLALVSVVAIVASTWAVNVGNAYSAGLAFTAMAGKGEESYKLTTMIAGIVGLVAAAVGIMDYFTTFLTFLSAMVPALAGTMIADYFFIRKGRPRELQASRGHLGAGRRELRGGRRVCHGDGRHVRGHAVRNARFPAVYWPCERHCRFHDFVRDYLQSHEVACI